MSSISLDGKYVHLWDLLTDVPAGDVILSKRCERRRELGQRAKNKLNIGARVMGQEMEISAHEDGWEIGLFSCFGKDGVTEIVKLFVPRDKGKPVALLAPNDEVVVIKEEEKWVVPASTK